MTYSVLIADDHPIYRVGLRQILDREAHYCCIEANDGGKAIELIIKNRPDIALLDIKMPVAGGLDVLKRTVHASPETLFIIFMGVPTKLHKESIIW